MPDTAAPGQLGDATFLRLLWLASPALPVGGFSYSEGLESAVDSARVTGEVQAGDWLLDQMHLGLARAELPLVARAVRAWKLAAPRRIAALNDWMRVTRESAEARRQSEQMGRSMLEWLRQGEYAADPRVAALAALQQAPCWPLAFALAAALAGAAPRQALLAYAFGWAENMVQAALKAVPLGQAAAQRMLTRLAQQIPDIVDPVLTLPQHRWQASLPMLGVLAAQHETQYSRLFRS